LIMTGNGFAEQTGGEKEQIEGLAFVIIAAVCVLASTFFAFSYFSRFDKQSEIVLRDKVNPNDAPVASLVRLPGIGPGRAEAIVAYRKKFVKTTGKQAFEDCDDLQKVKGIGPKTAEGLRKWLRFE